MAMCCGFDGKGRPVGFVVDPAWFRDNLARQSTWAGKVAVIDEMMQQAIKVGGSADYFWPLLQAMLPADLDVDVVGLSGAVDEGVADLPDELLERCDDGLGEPLDGRS